MLDVAAGGRTEGEAVRLLQRSGEDGGLHPGKQDSVLDSTIKGIQMQKKKKFMW